VTGTTEKIDPKFQETGMNWYRGAKVVEIFTTSYSEICKLKKRGWEPETGKAAKAAEPYLVFRIPLRALTFRSRTAVMGRKKS
jgi:hypothetical protein